MPIFHLYSQGARLLKLAIFVSVAVLLTSCETLQPRSQVAVNQAPIWIGARDESGLRCRNTEITDYKTLEEALDSANTNHTVVEVPEMGVLPDGYREYAAKFFPVSGKFLVLSRSLAHCTKGIEEMKFFSAYVQNLAVFNFYLFALLNSKKTSDEKAKGLVTMSKNSHDLNLYQTFFRDIYDEEISSYDVQRLGRKYDEKFDNGKKIPDSILDPLYQEVLEMHNASVGENKK